MRFQDKIAVVTGAASGFGAAIAKCFAAEGASVVVADVDEAGGKEITASICESGGAAIFARVDVSQADQVKGMIDAAVAEYGGLDILVNNAGFSHRMMPLWDLPEEEYDRVFSVNAKGVYLGAKYAVPVLQKRGGGVIVNTASIGAVAPRPGVTAYNATKGAVVTMTRGLAMEVAPYRIRVNAVNPVASDTAFFKGALGVDAVPEPIRKGLIEGIPLGRLSEPLDVANAVLFLASEDASFITGVCLEVDGGRSIS
jgi:3-oxoacyl-[acyl-carrier protein] reductase